MKNKILYIILAIVFIIALILTATIGLRVDLSYGEGTEIALSIDKNIDIKEINQIAEEIWKSANVQSVEFLGDSAIIKVKEASNEEIETLRSKINEKYETELTEENMSVNHVSNIKLRNIIGPYIIPVGLSTLLILGYYAIRYKGAKKMLNLLKYLVISEGILYSIYAICRVPVNELTMPIATIVYALVVLASSTKLEIEN